MLKRLDGITKSIILLLTVCFLGGCVTPGGGLNVFERENRIERTASSFEEAGKKWGTKHWQEKRTAAYMSVDDTFVDALIDPNYLDFFWVHADLKNAFVKGYRLGYQDRTADLVLGPNLTAAAARIGKLTGKGFVDVINAFEKGWADTLKRAIDVFITLISEGSQQDREKFITQFVDEYKVKYNDTQRMLKEGGFMTQVSEGGTQLYIDYSKGKTLGALDIPKPEILKTEIYHQTFKVMGDEWGRRFSTNLIKRDELIDLLRRSKTALDEVSPGLAGNLSTVKKAFINSYGTDAGNVFDGLIKDAGYTVRANSSSQPGRTNVESENVRQPVEQTVAPTQTPSGSKKKR